MNPDKSYSEVESYISKYSDTFKRAVELLPQEYRLPITILYAFVRHVDNLIDVRPNGSPDNRIRDYYSFRAEYHKAVATGESDVPVINGFLALCTQYKFDPAWIESFFKSMEMDLHRYTYQSWGDTFKYMYGSAGVIGLMCAKIFGITEDGFAYAEALGNAFQLINFIRDMNFDMNTLGRSYMPKDEFLDLGIQESLLFNEDATPHKVFNMFLHRMLAEYRKLLKDARPGFNFLKAADSRIFIAVFTAMLLFDKVASRIETNPQILKQEQKLKPNKIDIIAAVIEAILNLTGKFDKEA